MDITDGTPGQLFRGEQKGSKAVVRFPKLPSHNESVSPLLEKLDKDSMYKNLERFSAFHTRYYKSDYGKQSSAWLYEKVEGTLKEAKAEGYGAKVETFPHSWGQNSIIATIPGQSENTIVIAAHQDSINLFLPSLLAAPGADDDGSGTVTILEALRVILKSDEIMHGNATNTLEFHWYSAEEGGLLGSQAVFKQYEEKGRKVKAMLQQDMTGYTKGTTDEGEPESVGIITDYVDPGLTQFMKEIITAVRYARPSSAVPSLPFPVLSDTLRRNEMVSGSLCSKIDLQADSSLTVAMHARTTRPPRKLDIHPPSL